MRIFVMDMADKTEIRPGGLVNYESDEVPRVSEKIVIGDALYRVTEVIWFSALPERVDVIVEFHVSWR